MSMLRPLIPVMATSLEQMIFESPFRYRIIVFGNWKNMFVFLKKKIALFVVIKTLL